MSDLGGCTGRCPECVGFGCTGASTASGQPGIPGDDRIRDTLSDAGFPPIRTYDGVTHATEELLNHPAVVKHGQGMTSADLASFVEALGSMAQSRIKGIGHEQYAQATRQQFEDMTPAQVGEYLLEEVADGFNYLSMIAIKALAAVRTLGG